MDRFSVVYFDVIEKPKYFSARISCTDFVTL